MAYFDVVKREVDIFSKNPLAWFITIIFPLFMCILICIIFGKSTPTNLPIAILNNDNSEVSRLIVRYVKTLPSCEIKYDITDLHEGKELLLEGKIYAILVIPKNFQKDIYKQKQPKLVFYYNNQRLLIGGIITKDVTMLAKSMVIGMDAKLRSRTQKIPLRTALERANRLNIVEHVKSNPYFNYMYLLALPAIGHIMQISMIFSIIWAIGMEFKFGKTKEWMKTANNSIVIAVSGKLTPYAIIFFISFYVIYFIYFVLYQAPYKGSILTGLLATFLFIFSSFAIGIIFISLNGNFRYCLSNAAFYSAIGFALANISFPTTSMPLIMQIYASTMPLTYWTKIITDQSIRNIPVIYDLQAFIAFVSIIAISLLLCYRLKFLVIDEKRWYQA